jgi:hypothetical protein
VGVPVAVSGGHAVAQLPVHALVVAPGWSLLKVYKGRPAESASTWPIEVERTVTVAVAEPLEPGWPADTDDDFELLEQAAATTARVNSAATAQADPLRPTSCLDVIGSRPLRVVTVAAAR